MRKRMRSGNRHRRFTGKNRHGQKRLPGNPTDLKKFFDDLDLVIMEGYKKENKPKIEVVRSARHVDALLKADKHLVAVVSDMDLKLEVPGFGLEDIDRLADFIEEKYLL